MMTILSGRWVFDSNILIYALDENSPMHSQTKEIFAGIKQNIISGVVAQQNIVETERVFVKAYKIPLLQVISSVTNLISEFQFTIIAPLPTTYQTYHRLVSTKDQKKELFDYFLAATMLDNGISQILTVNSKDFSSIAGIEAVNPFSS